MTKGNAQPLRGLAEPMAEHVPTGELEALLTGHSVASPGSTLSHAGMPGQHRISVRVDEKHHLRLRLASAHVGKSRQDILLDALEHYLKVILPAYLHDSCPCIDGRGEPSGPECCSGSED
jgi:hypothetical protein